MNKAKELAQRTFAANGILAKALTIIFLILIYLSVVTIVQEYHYDPTAIAFSDLQNISRAVSIVVILMPFILSTLQHDFLYFGLSRKKPKLDERQTAIYGRIMERSYHLGVAIAGVCAYTLWVDKIGIINVLQHQHSNDWVWLLFDILSLMAALPLLMTIWRKDIYLEEDKKRSVSGQKVLFWSLLLVLFGIVWSYLVTDVSNLTHSSSPIFGVLMGVPGVIYLVATIAILVVGISYVLNSIMGRP